MTWTFDPDSAVDTDLEKVRVLCGDTDTNNQLIQDEQIAFYLDEQGDNVYMAAAQACRAIAAAQSAKPDLKMSRLSISQGSVAQMFLRRATTLEMEAAKYGTPFFGGQSEDGKSDLNENTDLPTPRFTRTQFKHPQADEPDGDPDENLGI